MTKKTGGRNGKIELWRFLFSVIIVIHHSRYLVGDKNCMFLGGSLAVEFFFLISGYLMMASIARKKEAPGELGRETLGYLGRKFKSLMPEMLVAYVIAVIFVAVTKDYNLKKVVKLCLDTFFEITQLKMSGLHAVSLNGVTWYISTMLLCMAVLYPLIRRFPDMMVRIVAPLTALLLLGYLSGNYDSPRTPLKWIGLTFKGNIRGMAEICLGIVCYSLCEKFKSLSLSKLGKWLVTAAEWLCYAVAVVYMFACKASQYDYIVIVILMAGVILSFSHQGMDADFFDKRFFVLLGKCSMPLFLCHTFYASNLNRLLPENWGDNRRMAVYLLCAVVTAAFVSLVSNGIRKVTPRFVAATKRALLEKEN